MKNKLLPVLHDASSPLPLIPPDEKFPFLAGQEYDALRGELQGKLGHCEFCGRRCRARSNLNHLIPRSRGGAHTRTNLALTCYVCNSRKGALTFEEFAALVIRSLRQFHRQRRHRELTPA